MCPNLFPAFKQFIAYLQAGSPEKGGDILFGDGMTYEWFQ